MNLCLGLGVTGISAMRFLRSKRCQVIGTDDRIETLQENDVPIDMACRLLQKGAITAVIASPGIPRCHCLLSLAKECNIPILNDIELGFQHMPVRRPVVIGITGTNGKTTVALLVTHILQMAGFVVHCIGNIGNAFLDDFDARMQADVLVVELSSQQLEHVVTPCIDIGCIVNISANHLDWHDSMDEYIANKLKLTRLVHSNNIFIPTNFPYCEGTRIGEGGDIYIKENCIMRFQCNEIELSKQFFTHYAHDQLNFLFAYGICRSLNIAPCDAVLAFQSFQKPAHRIQFITMRHGVYVYDDSKASNVQAVLHAVHAVPGPVQLIAGGVHKGASYRDWVQGFANKVEHVFAIGEAKSLIARDLSPCIPVIECTTLEDAVAEAFKVAKDGGSVLLSPGCSSFDMFRNYQERGEKFQQAVRA